MKGDKGRFTRPDGLRYAWQTIAPLLKDKPDVINYRPKTWGPEEAAALAAPYGWLKGNSDHFEYMALDGAVVNGVAIGVHIAVGCG